jgi:nitrate reductase (cytochrome), electron transfer subunit
VTSPDPKSYQKGAWLVGAILLTASVSGFFMGLRQTGSQISMTRPISLVTRESERSDLFETNAVPVAVAYARQDWLRDGANGRWENRLGNLVQSVPDSSALTNVTEAQRDQSLLERAARRAFDGAPPVVPHPIAQDSSAACLACHGPALAVKNKVASKISHASYSSCTQCHVPADGPGIPAGPSELQAPIAKNEFVHAHTPRKGARAWPEAPPTIPHNTFMRSDCLSCHGPRGLFGLRTPHPERQSCGQCHVADARLEQHSFYTAAHEHSSGIRSGGSK